MKIFRRLLRERQPARTDDRRWLFVPYDQLSDAIGPLADEPAGALGIVVVESPWKASQRPYHQQKLALLLANLRHFCLEQATRGVAVRHLVSRGSYAHGLRAVTGELGPLRVMEPAERELRQDLAPLVDEGLLEVVPHPGWLTGRDAFDALGDAPWRMDAFYRRVRERSGILMTGDGKPEGGRFSFDTENRKPWKGEPEPPAPPCFAPDPVTEEVGALVEERFGRHPGRLDLEALPATRDDAETLWRWALDHCLPHFGPYEDAMSVVSRGLFHTRVAPLLNLHRLLPRRVVDDVLGLDIPLASQEGFVRQVLGWREFVRHVHRATDGFRSLPDGRPPTLDRPGDGGWGRWQGEFWSPEGHGEPAAGGAAPSFLDAEGDLPVAYWGQPSGLACLDRVVSDVWHEGWSHHITRLMVLANLATLLDISPRQLTDWFWVAYIDAYDWVVEPNVLAMGTFGTGALMTTKPYVSGAAYIHRMSDYCAACRFDPKKTCPITSLYWDFLARHRDALASNRRLALPLENLERRSAEQKRADHAVFDHVRATLAAGRVLEPPTA